MVSTAGVRVKYVRSLKILICCEKLMLPGDSQQETHRTPSMPIRTAPAVHRAIIAGLFWCTNIREEVRCEGSVPSGKSATGSGPGGARGSYSNLASVTEQCAHFHRRGPSAYCGIRFQ